jgi:LacI family transcriptional regulator
MKKARPAGAHAARGDSPIARASALDVARAAGVSSATVSRVLNSPERVDPQTRERVQEAVRLLRYVPHGGARSLRSRRSRMIGAVVPSFEYALYARTTSALQRRLNAQAYSVVVAEHHYDLAKEMRVAAQLIEHGVDAFMFVGLDHAPELFALLEEHQRPYVLTWGADPRSPHPNIGFDNAAATYALARHLITLGHRRFGLLSAEPQHNDRARARGAGLRRALREAGLALDPRHVRYAPISLRAAETAMSDLLMLPDRPTAVLGTNDVFGVGALLACRRLGVRVPEDISITGVDNTELGETQQPGLTSVATPIVEIGTAAAEHLIARLEGRVWERCLSLPVQLVFRASTGPAPRARRGPGRHSA